MKIVRTFSVRSQVQITSHIKVVIRLSVNRLPVKLPITGFNVQLPIYRHFSSRNAIFGFSFVSHVHTGPVVLKDAWARIEAHGRELRHMGAHGAAWTRTDYAWLD